MSTGDSNMQLWAKATASEQENERRVVNWLGVIALASLAGVVVLALDSGRTVGIDTAVIVALVGIIAQCASSLGTRRTRVNTPDSDAPQPTAAGASVGWSAVYQPTVVSATSGNSAAATALTATPIVGGTSTPPDDDDTLEGH